MTNKNKAPESYQVQKARKKLIKQIEKEKKLVSQKTINQMKLAIQIWIKRHESERVPLQDRPIRLFDENAHSAQTKSKYVADLMQTLRGSRQKESKETKTLTGRILPAKR